MHLLTEYPSILAAYDLGASAPLLQAIYDSEQPTLLPIDVAIDLHDISEANWTTRLGDNKCVN